MWTPSARLSWCALGLVVLGCGGTESAPSAPSSPPLAPPGGTPSTPRVEAFTLTQGVEHVVQDVRAMLIDVSVGDDTHPPQADVSFGDDRVTLVAGGCVAASFGVVASDRVGPGPAPWAHFRWTASGADVDGSDQAPHDAPVASVLTSTSWRLSAVAVEPRSSGVTRVWVTFSSPSFDDGVPHRLDVDVPAGGEVERALTGYVSVAVALAGPDAIGCPTPRIAIIDPRALVLDVGDGETLAVRAGTTLRLGDRTVRYDGLGEARTTRGDRALFSLTFAAGTEHERTTTCALESACIEGDLSVEWVSHQGVLTTLLVRRVAAAP